MSRITLWLGQKLGNLLPALFISAVSYCLPALLSLSGMKNGIEWLGFYPLFHAAALWQNQGYTADGESYNAMWIPIFLACAAFFLAWAIGQALIDDYDMIGVQMKYYKNLSIDESDFSVQRQGCRIHLTTTEYQLFITLLDHSGHICSRNFLLASAWNITVPIQTRTVDVHIAKLRKKLDLGPDDLKTVMGRGYALSV
jgi:hypothetical protein